MESVVNEERNSETSHDRVDDHTYDQANERDNDRVDDRANDQADDHDDDQTDDQITDQAVDHKSGQADDKDDEQGNDTAIEKCSKQQNTSSDIGSSQNSTNVITQQPKSSVNTPSTKPIRSDPTDTEQQPIPVTGVDDDGVEVEIAFEPGTCLSASASVGSASKDLCNGFTNLECRYPNVGCDLSCACDGGLQLVSECTMELCSANCILGCLGFSLGLALDTKATWNQDGVEFEVLGTGIETSQGKVLRFLGSGIGIIDGEKREIMIKKRKVKEARRAQKKAAKEKAANEEEKIEEEATELEISGKDNIAADIEDEGGASPQTPS